MARKLGFETYSTSPDGSNFHRRGTSLHQCHPGPKRVTNAVVETVAEDPSLGPLQAKSFSSLGDEELTRVKCCITENILKAREQLNLLNEPTHKLDSYHRPMWPRKRSRIGLPAPVPNKQVHIRNESSEVEWCPNMPKPSEIISRERYISMSGDCLNNMPKQSRYMLGYGKPASLLKHQDQTLPAGIESCEKAKMTGRCSGMMSDVSVKAVTKMFDGDRDYKQGIQQRPSTESHLRPGESHCLRSNISNNRALQPSRLKNEKFSSLSAFSESKESGAGNKCKNNMKIKIKKQGDTDVKIVPVCQDAGSLVLPLIKAKTLIKEESGDGVQRPGSSGKASSLLRMNAPLSGKLENPATTKQPRSKRLGTDKVASKTVRQPIKKILLDQKPVTRPRCPMNSGSSDFTGDLDDSEEHLAALNASNNASDVACSGPLWKLMEPFFASLTRDDPDFFKHLVREVEEEYAILINPPGSNRTGEAYLICSMPPANRKLYDGPQEDCLYCTSEESLCGNCTQIESNNENAGKVELEIEPEVEMKNWKHHMTDYCNYNSLFANGHQNHVAENNCRADLRQDEWHSEILGFNAEYRGLDEWHARVGK